MKPALPYRAVRIANPKLVPIQTPAATKPEKHSTEKTTSTRVRREKRKQIHGANPGTYKEQDKSIIAMARICRRKTEVLLVVEEIILEIVFMLSVIINRYRNMSQFRGLNVENVRRYRMADRIPQQIEHMSELVGMSDTDCFDNLRLNREAFNRLCYLLRHMGG
ncbi:hypothetical protein ACS0TY_018302 [Phlomoides rotata]